MRMSKKVATLKCTYFFIIGLSNMKMVADKHSHAAGNIHFDGINVDD